jgi:O-antigen/teichoic acid export membrane protein
MKALAGLQRKLRSALASDFVRKVLETFATRILLIGIGLVTGVIVARILGPEKRGLFAVAGAISAIGVQFGNLGLHSANAYAVSRNRDLLPELLANSLVVSLAVGVAGGAITWTVFGLRPDLAPIPGVLLALVLASIPISLAYLLVQNLLLGIQEVRTFNKVELSTRIVTVGLIVLVIISRRVSPETVFVAGLIAGAANLAWILRHLRPFLPRRPAVSWPLLRENIGYGLKAYLACFFAFMVTKFDLLMVQYMLGSEQTGYYSIAVSMADLIYLLPMVIGAILFPKLSAMETRDEKWTLARRTTLVSGLLMVGLGAVAVPLAKPAIHLLFGSPFLPATAPFVVLAVAMIFLGANTMLSQFHASTGFPWFAVHVWIVATLINVGLNLFLIPVHGITGAAAASLACYLGVLVAQYLYAIRASGRISDSPDGP